MTGPRRLALVLLSINSYAALKALPVFLGENTQIQQALS